MAASERDCYSSANTDEDQQRNADTSSIDKDTEISDKLIAIKHVSKEENDEIIVSEEICRESHEDKTELSLLGDESIEIPDYRDEKVIIQVGIGFDHYTKLERAIQAYERQNHVKLYRRDSRSLVSIINRGRAPKKKFSMNLKYGEISYRCRYGGKKYKSFSTGVRPNQSTFKQGCEMHIRFGVSDDGSQLVVKSMSEEHNHEINEETIVKEALHPELCSYVSKLVWSDINIGIDEVKRRLENYVCDEMFKDQTPPPRTRRQYFPSKKQIRYFMAKAKASLNISQEAELKLEAQAEKLKETRGDEKMIFNFKVSHDATLPTELVINNEESVGDTEDEFFAANNPTRETKPVIDPQLVNEVQNAKILFCHQTPHQQRLMRRYSSQVILTQISDIHSKIPFPLFCLYVQTNVDFQLVGEFILQANTCAMLTEGLQTFREWNPGWNPKFVVVDFSEDQINSVESVFPGTFVLISDASREKAWSDWLSLEENEVYEHKEEITSYLQAIANSYSEDMLNNAARELEESDVWKMSDKLRNWFQINWLSQAKRWVAGYRPDDYLMLTHHGRTLESELKAFKSIKLVNKSAPLQDVIQQIVEHVAPVARKQYELLNQESVKLQNELKYLYPDIPNYLTFRPGKLTYHIYERLKSAAERSYTLSYLHPGIFSVQGCGDDDILHTVSFGDSNSFPSCDCHDWQCFKLPCVHLCAVFNSYPGWTWDMLSVAYKSSPVLNVDWSLPETSGDLPGNIVDKGTQTSDANLISKSTQLSKMGKMTDSRRLTETPQVLASQCRGLLQQLLKVNLTVHSRDILYRLKSELKELVSMFSVPLKPKSMTSLNLTDTYVIQSKGINRPRKLNHSDIQSDTGRSVFEQYNVTPVTPRQVHDAGERKVYPSRSRTSSSELVISKPPGEPSGSQDQDNIVGTVYIVDPTRVLVNTKDKCSTPNVISQNQLQSAMKLKTNSISRKRIESPSVFLKPPEKRLKDEIMHHDHNFDGDVALEFTQENVDDAIRNDDSLHHDEGLHDDTLLTVDEDSSISGVIDGQTINIQLEQVSVAIANSDSMHTSPTSTELPVTISLNNESIGPPRTSADLQSAMVLNDNSIENSRTSAELSTAIPMNDDGSMETTPTLTELQKVMSIDNDSVETPPASADLPIAIALNDDNATIGTLPPASSVLEATIHINDNSAEASPTTAELPMTLSIDNHGSVQTSSASVELPTTIDINHGSVETSPSLSDLPKSKAIISTSASTELPTVVAISQDNSVGTPPTSVEFSEMEITSNVINNVSKDAMSKVDITNRESIEVPRSIDAT